MQPSALTLHSREPTLTHGQKPDGTAQFTTPRHPAHEGEDPTTALTQKPLEELGPHDTASPAPPRLRHAWDQLTTRPHRPGVLHHPHLNGDRGRPAPASDTVFLHGVP